MYKIKDKLMLFFQSLRKQDLLLSIKLKKFCLTLANHIDTFEALNNLNLILPDKNIKCINDYVAINAFVAKLGLGIVKSKKKCSFFS